MRLSGHWVERTKTLIPLVHGGGLTKVIVPRKLLKPAGKEIFGILHINGTPVYIPKDRQICIGSARSCDVRIVDNLIEGLHILMTPHEQGIDVTNFSHRRLAVKMEGSKDITTFTFEEGADLQVSENADMFLELSGIGSAKQKRLLEIKIEIPKRDVTEAVQKLFEAKPEIVRIEPDQAIAKLEPGHFIMETIALNESLVAETELREATNLENAFQICFQKIADNKRQTIVKLSLFGILSTIGMVCGAMVGSIFLIEAGLISIIASAIRYTIWSKKDKIAGQVMDLMKYFNAKEIAKALPRRSQREIKEICLWLEWGSNHLKAMEIREELKKMYDRIDVAPQLEPRKP
ncbi:hypothetical protein HZC35_07385 [Candidatus Saganbacteria bacterium]|nr:hypothetical protein [Candidatus Saganbacteria bacterium]